MRVPAIITIGGSAGSLDALCAILVGLPDRFAVPIVVVLHVPAAHQSVLPELFSRAAARPVREVEDKLEMVAGGVYVAPADYHVLVERDGRLALSIDAPVRFSRPSIDVLFDSAVDAFGARVTGVVLSGANDDGARGLARIRAAGGTAIIQDPATAALATMPAAARALVGPSAHVCAAEAIASLLDTLAHGAVA